jgi:uridine phosphorylase
VTFPILEFDPEREALIEPGRLYSQKDVPEHCVICFFQDVIDQVIDEKAAATVVENYWEDGPHRLFEIDVDGKRLAFFHPGIGSAMAASTLEEVIAFGCRKFIACGGCGALDKDIGLGNLVVLTGAVRDEGASYHYIPPAREVSAQPGPVAELTAVLDQKNLPFRLGKTWTTDAPYRETKARIEARRKEGCAVVEMEAAGLMAVAQFRRVEFGQIVYGGDDLSGETWDHRGWHTRTEVREGLFWLAAEACLRL